MKCLTEKIVVELYVKEEIDEQLLILCEDIVDENHVDNGGFLKRYNIVSDGNTEYIICAKDNGGKVLGFMALRKNCCRLNDIYIRQMAVSPKVVGRGVGSKLIECLFEMVRGKFDYVSADISKDNKNSYAFFVGKYGFKEVPARLRYSKRYIFDLRGLEKEENSKKVNKK